MRFFYFFSSLASLFDIWKSDRQIRRGKKQSALLDEGYVWEQKIRDFVEFSIKNLENLMFWFFSDLRLSDSQNWSEQKVKLIHTSRATRGYQNIGDSSNSMRYGFLSKYVNYTYTNSK